MNDKIKKDVEGFLNINPNMTKFIKDEYKNCNKEYTDDEVYNFMIQYEDFYKLDVIDKSTISKELLFKFAYQAAHNYLMPCFVNIIDNYIPEQIKIYDFYYKLISEYAFPIEYVPINIRDYNMYTKAALVFATDDIFDNDYSYLNVICSVPHEIMDEKLVDILIESACRGKEKDLDSIYLDEEMSVPICYIPEKFINKKISEICFNNYYWSYPYIPDKYKTREMLIKIIEFGDISDFILDVPKEHITYSIVLDIMKNDNIDPDEIIDILEYIPENCKGFDIYKYAIINILSRFNNEYKWCLIDVESIDKLLSIIPNDIKVNLNVKSLGLIDRLIDMKNTIVNK